MLTPPSRHLKVMQQNVAESKVGAEIRREQSWSVKVAADRANALERRRQKLKGAQREREAFLAREARPKLSFPFSLNVAYFLRLVRLVVLILLPSNPLTSDVLRPAPCLRWANAFRSRCRCQGPCSGSLWRLRPRRARLQVAIGARSRLLHLPPWELMISRRGSSCWICWEG